MVQGPADSYDKKRYFYLSTSRTKNATRSYGSSKEVRVSLDGWLLKQRYSGKPINYWMTSKGDSHSLFEFEDRILTYSPYIPNARKYITRVDVFCRREPTTREKYLMWNFKGVGIPIFFYNDRNAFSIQSDKTINDIVEQTEIKPETDDFPLKDRCSVASILAPIFYFHFWDEYDKIRNWYKLISPIMRKYGFQDEITKTVNYLNDHKSVNEWASDVIGHSRTDFRKLNSRFGDIGERVQRLIADVYRSEGVSNTRELVLKKKKM